MRLQCSFPNTELDLTPDAKTGNNLFRHIANNAANREEYICSLLTLKPNMAIPYLILAKYPGINEPEIMIEPLIYLSNPKEDRRDASF